MNSTRIVYLIAPLVLLLFTGSRPIETDKKEQQAQTPNIIVIYVDDLGFADVGSYGARGVQTPHIDSLAHNGLRFTDAHSPAATCTPSRYTLLTGRYAFRNNAGILPGDAPLLIDTERTTLPSMLQKAGYKTAVVGKWHLGLGNGNINWNKPIKPGPKEVGFDYSWLIPATGDRVPTVYVENQEVVNLDPEDPINVSYDEPIGETPTGLEHPELLRYGADDQHAKTIVNGISRIGYMAGGKSARWKDENFPFLMLQKARKFIKDNQDSPFFLYFSFHDIHVPRLPHPLFQGSTDMGVRGDAIVQMDWTTGQLVKTLEKSGIDENTLVIFSSDNGPVLDDGYDDKAVEMIGHHNPAGPFRGGKYSIFEGGTRVPFITYWPGTIEPGVSDALINQGDLLASLAALTGQKLSKDEGPDSENLLDALLGQSDQGREVMVEEAGTLALREGPWKYIRPGEPNPWIKERKGIEGGLQPKPQLYNLSKDINEQTNLAKKYPERVKAMQEKLKEIENEDK